MPMIVNRALLCCLLFTSTTAFSAFSSVASARQQLTLVEHAMPIMEPHRYEQAVRTAFDEKGEVLRWYIARVDEESDTAVAEVVIMPHTRASSPVMQEDAEGDATKGSKLEGKDTTTYAFMVDKDQLAEPNAVRGQVNKFFPLVVIGLFALNFATGGALEKIELPEGPTPPGVEQARKLKAEKGYF